MLLGLFVASPSYPYKDRISFYSISEYLCILSPILAQILARVIKILTQKLKTEDFIPPTIIALVFLFAFLLIMAPKEPIDRVYYQTVFAQIEGSVAAPTASLHFSEELLKSVSSTSTFPPVGFFPYSLAGKTFELLKTKRSPSSK